MNGPHLQPIWHGPHDVAETARAAAKARHPATFHVSEREEREACAVVDLFTGEPVG